VTNPTGMWKAYKLVFLEEKNKMPIQYIIVFELFQKNCLHNRFDWLGCAYYDQTETEPKSWGECNEEVCPALKDTPRKEKD